MIVKTQTQPDEQIDEDDEWIVPPVRLNAIQRTARIARMRQLQHEYPGQYVACREVWDGDALQEPFVVVVGASYTEVLRKLEALPEQLQEMCCITFLNPPGRAMGYATR